MENINDLIKDLIREDITDRLFYPQFVSILGFVWYYAGVFCFILLFQYLFSETLRKAADKVLHHPLRAAFLGMLFFTAVPVAIYLMMATLIGLPLGILILTAYIVLILLGSFIASVSAANWMNGITKGDWKFWTLSLVALVIFLIINFLLMLPVVGWIVLGILSCLAFGGILANVSWKGINKIQN
ncbi:hypothetical protein [Pedobacter caeni]|uniref:DUF8173 domain-containing protein n=1 Tax=Pedobacter caeni TaxID=288992 RepID=A0A1M5BBY1_9SPHI|nr:hypothetical protein [Pedobacter caeni]SHF40019.1 hypothetical protein SAMN04488522_1021126 [Pedobacter caeni]